VNLGDLLSDAAEGLSDVLRIAEPDGSVAWSRGGEVFAALSPDGSAAEFFLDPAVADAALRTPDTSPSGRGRGWVILRPTVLDDHGADRAAAWFASAHRRLTPG
jgi:hypothetical protein